MPADAPAHNYVEINSKLILRALSSHNETTVARYFYRVNFIEPFLYGRRNKFLKRCRHRRCRNFLFAGTQIISLHRFPQARFEKVSHRPKARPSSRLYIPGSVGRQRIGVVNYKRLPALQTRSHQQLFPPPRAQHIQINPHVGIEKPLAEKCAFAGSLNPNKNYCFHVVVNAFGYVSLLEIVATFGMAALIRIMCTLS
jgi:hypothetical protein